MDARPTQAQAARQSEGAVTCPSEIMTTAQGKGHKISHSPQDAKDKLEKKKEPTNMTSHSTLLTLKNAN